MLSDINISADSAVPVNEEIECKRQLSAIARPLRTTEEKLKFGQNLVKNYSNFLTY